MAWKHGLSEAASSEEPSPHWFTNVLQTFWFPGFRQKVAAARQTHDPIDPSSHRRCVGWTDMAKAERV